MHSVLTVVAVVEQLRGPLTHMVRNAVETLFRAKPHTDLNPDEVVALGAAVQAGIPRQRPPSVPSSTPKSGTKKEPSRNRNGW